MTLDEGSVVPLLPSPPAHPETMSDATSNNDAILITTNAPAVERGRP
jgi:hypothetical protein